MHLDEPVPQGCSIVIKDQHFWLANAAGVIIEPVLYGRDRRGQRLWFYLLDANTGPTNDPYNCRWLRE